MAKNGSHRLWTPYENMIRASLRAEGMSGSQIAAILGRSREAIGAYESRIGEQCERRPWHPLHDNARLLSVLGR